VTPRPVELTRAAVVWVDFDPTTGSEQRGTRPALVVSSADYLASVRGPVVVLPVTSTWTGLSRPGFAMTEQPRTISTIRISRRTGTADAATMTEVDRWLQDFLGIRP